MPVRLHSREYVEEQLKKRRCIRIKDYPHGSAVLWTTRSGYAFVVPMEADGRTDENTLKDILLELDGCT